MKTSARTRTRQGKRAARSINPLDLVTATSVRWVSNDIVEWQRARLKAAGRDPSVIELQPG